MPRARMGDARDDENETRFTQLDTYKSLLRIDKRDLDTELEVQAETFFKVSEKCAECISLRDQAKTELEKITAEIDVDIRRNPPDDKKLSETQILNLVKTDPEYLHYQGKYFDLRLLASKWEALKEAFVQRSYALKDLSNLYTSGYWTDASTGSAKSAHVEKAAEAARASMNEKRREYREGRG